jgi:hypothetical protein
MNYENDNAAELWQQEIISNYIINIDGVDRDVSYYPNPFKIIVAMGQTGTLINPYINKSFRNVKFVKLHYIILPRYILYQQTVNDSGYREYTILTTGTIMSCNRFLLLRIREITNLKTLSTGNNIKDECFMMIRNNFDSDAISDVWYIDQNIRIFNDSELKDFTKLTIEILDPTGNQLVLQYTDGTNIFPIPATDINNPDSTQTNFGNFTNSIDIRINLEFGVCEHALNTTKSYR